MTTKRKALANACNAKLSTGPRTAAGLTRASRNATKHAIYSSTPVLPGVERQEQWDAHVAATVDALAPATYLERALAERAALLLWRLGRVTRYEVHEASGAIAAVPDDVAERRRERMTGLYGRREHVPVTVEQARDDADAMRGVLSIMKRFAAAAPADRVPDDDAVEIAHLWWRGDDGALAEETINRRPDDGWTAHALLTALEATPDDLQSTMSDASIHADDAARKQADIEAEVSRLVTARTLSDAPTLEKVQRYEGHLERSLFRTLRELREMQRCEGG